MICIHLQWRLFCERVCQNQITVVSFKFNNRWIKHAEFDLTQKKASSFQCTFFLIFQLYIQEKRDESHPGRDFGDIDTTNEEYNSNPNLIPSFSQRYVLGQESAQVLLLRLINLYLLKNSCDSAFWISSKPVSKHVLPHFHLAILKTYKILKFNIGSMANVLVHIWMFGYI